MKDFSYFHDSFNLRKLSSYFLQIQLSKFGIGYVITDAIRNQYIAVKNKVFENPDESLLLNFQNAVREDVYLNKHYKAVNFFYVSEKNTLIPSDYFDKKYLKDYFKFSFVLQKNDEVHFNYLEKTKAYNVFSMPSILINFLVNHFPEIRFYHYTTPFIKAAFKDIEGSKSVFDTVRVSFQHNLMNIVVIKNHKLMFFNDFDYNSEADAVFYIMNVIKKLFINLRRVDFSVQGTIMRGDKLHGYLKNYIPNIKFVDKFSKEFPFKEVPMHVYANLLNSDVN